ncbi:MAG: hypothetical protein K2M94_00200 [Paramuribaculum sp.]|nr:hypothetical protein [Paramuribaculum sp.]
MNRITFMSQSGYVEITDSAILVFDYYTDPSHALHKALDNHPDLPVIFFVSHYHQRHLSNSMFEIAQSHKRVYVMSNDILPQIVPGDLPVAGMSKGDVIEDLPGGIKVKAYGSTGPGVSFLVTTADGTDIFYGGTITGNAQVQTHNHKQSHTADFEVLINHIASEVSDVDVAYLSVDFLQEQTAVDTLNRFATHIHTGNMVAMNIGGTTPDADKLQAQMPEGTLLHCLNRPGESIDIAHD